MTRHRDQDRGGPTTYPPTPGDRNEEARSKRGFGRPAGGGTDDTTSQHSKEHNDEKQ